MSIDFPPVAWSGATDQSQIVPSTAARPATLAEAAATLEEVTIVDGLDGYRVDDTGHLWLPLDDGIELTAGDVFSIDDDTGQVHWWHRPPHPPRTVDEHNAQTEAARAAYASAVAVRRQRLQTARRPVTLALVDGDDALPTLAGALRWLTGHEASISVDDGHLCISVEPRAGNAPGLGDYGALELRRALRVLYCGEAVVVDHLQRGQPLPDRHVTPNGQLVP